MQLGKYRHYKGREYEVIGVARHSETLEALVVYKALYPSEEFGNEALRVRPLEIFQDKVVVDGKDVERFSYIGG